MTPHRLPVRQRGRVFWPLLILLIVIAALAAAGWWGWQQWQRLENQRGELAGQVSSLRQALEQQQQQSRGQQQALEQLRDQQDRIEAAQARDRQALADVKKGGQRLWLINEAQSLASLASQRLLLTGDANAALHLLQAADKTLARIDDPSVLPARRALAVDMEKLKGATQVDITAVVLRLGALEELVPELAVPAQGKTPQPSAPKSGGGWWQGLLDHLPIQVHHRDGKMPLPLNDTQAALVRLSLEADLQQARLALMQARPKVYKQALDHAGRTVREWFREDDPRARQLLSGLKSLGGERVSQAMPDIGAGLAAIRQLKQDTGKRQGDAGGDDSNGASAAGNAGNGGTRS